MVTPVKSNQQHIFIHDALCEGPIDGLLYGDASIFLNGNRVKDIDPDAPWTPIGGSIDFSSSADTSGFVNSPSIPSNMVGTPKNNNFIVLRSAGITKSSSISEGTNGNISITGNSAFSIEYNTYNQGAFVPLQYPTNGSLPSTVTPSNGGSGYTSAPTVKVRYNVTNLEVANLTATATISNGAVTSISVSGSGNTGLIGAFRFEVSSPELIDNRFLALADPTTNDIIAIGEGKWSSGSTLTFIPSNINYNQNYWLANNNIPYKVQVIETREITSISSTNINIDEGPSLGAGTYTFTLTGSRTPSALDLDAENPGSSENFVAQFRGGHTFQEPIVELNGVGGGTAYTVPVNNLSNTILRQINYTVWNDNNPNDTLSGFNVHSTSDYPEGQTINSEGNTEPFIVQGSNFSANSDVVKSLDEVRISIAYSSLQAIRKDNGDDIYNYAKYLFQIARKPPGATEFEAYKHAFEDANGTHVGHIQHEGKDRSAISFEHYIDLSIIKPFDDFKIRIFRLTRPKGRGVMNGGGDQPPAWDTDQGDSTSSISNVVGINKDKFYYPYTAHAGLFLDSKEFTSVPQRSYEIRGMKVKVPEGYKPREYSSLVQSKTDAKSGTTSDYTVPTYPTFWSGAFSDELYYTNNPVWIFLDLITNDRFGAGEWINLSDIDIYSLYRVSKYCDELVPDGKGGFEPRYTANLYLSKATDVYKVVKDMATIFSSIVYWMDGKLSTVLDAPGDPVYSFSKSNVIDGAFAYESTGQKTRVNQVVVTWNDPSIGYEQANVIVEDRNDIVSSGRVISQNAVAFGCTSEGQARRYGKWKLFTAQGQSEVVSFRTSFEGLFLKPGDIIEVQDASRYGSMLSGRIAAVDTSGSNDVITVDRSLGVDPSYYAYKLNVLHTEPAAFYVGEDDLRLSSAGAIVASGGTTYSRGDRILTNLYVHEGGAYTSVDINTEARASNAFYLEVDLDNNTIYRPIELSWKKDSFIESKAINSFSGSEITISGKFESAPAVSSVWMIEETLNGTKTTGSPDLYKIIGIAQDEKNIYSISAVEHYNEKYAFVDDPDSIIDIPDDIYPIEAETIAAPTGIRILQNSNATRPNEELTIEWDYPELDNNGDPTNRFLDSFEVLHTIPGRQSSFFTDNRTRSLFLENVPDGTYMFRVRAISASQKKSAWTSFKYTVADPFSDKVNRIKGIQTEGLTSVYPFITNESDSSGGNFRGVYDVNLGAYVSGSNEDGYKEKDIVLYQGNYKYLPFSSDGGSATDITTWKDYRGGILKFSGDNSVTIAPSRFRRQNSVGLGSSANIDCNFLRKRASEYIGDSSSDGRFSYVVLDNDDGLKVVSSTVDRDFGVFYWYDVLHADNSSNTGVYKHWKDLSGSGTYTIREGENKVEGTGTSFTQLSNLDVILFTKDLFNGTPRTNVSFTASTKTISIPGGYQPLGSTTGIIEIESSSGLNQGRFTIASFGNNEIVVEENLVDESAGATITIHKLQFIAKVARVESNTVMYLDRKATATVDNSGNLSYGGTIFKQEYAPNYYLDVIIGRIRNSGSSGTGIFQFDNFLTFDPNLRGGREVQVDSNIAFLQFNADQEQVLAPDNITVTATAYGFDKPQFKITYGDPTTEPTDANGGYTIFEAEDTAFTAPSGGAVAVYKKEIWDGTTPITWGTGGNIQVHVSVIEENDPGDTSKQATDFISIPRVGDVAAGEGGRTVFLELEDYDIVYNAGGVRPSFTGGPTTANYLAGPNTYNPLLFLRLTATAGAGFGDPIFRFKVGGNVVLKTTGGADWFDPGGDIAFVDWPVPYSLSTTTNGVTTTPFGSEDGGSLIVVVEVAEKPDNWSSTAGDSANEPAAADIYAKDVDNILALRVGAGGIAVNFTNDSHVVACTPEGVVVNNASNQVVNSGGTMKVFEGGIALKYVASNPVHGEWTISGTSTTEDYNQSTGKGIQVGAFTQTQEPNNGPYVATVADHVFVGSLGDDPFEDQESITYELTVPQGAGKNDLTLEVSQTFALVKAGQGGVGQVYLYKSAAASPTPSGPTASFPQVKVNLQTGAIDTTGNDPNGNPVYAGGSGTNDESWYPTASSAVSSGVAGNVIWVVAAAAVGSGTFDYIENDEWTTAAQFNGQDGLNSAIIEIFQGTNSLTAPTLPEDVDYNFSTGAITATGSGTGLGSWSTDMPAPSRAAPYVWRSAASAISTSSTTTIDGVDNPDTDGEDWSTPQIVARFVEDGFTLELTNDAETVGAATASTALSNLSIQTIAKVFQAGNDITDEWTYTASGATGITVNTAGTGTDGNTFTVTALSSAFQSGNVVITAAPKSGGNYVGATSRSVNFTITKVANGQDGVSYRITTSDAAVVYDPNSNPVSWSPTSVTFSASKITPTGSTSFTSGYWKLNGSNQGQASSVSSGTISFTSGNITAQLYLDSSYTQLVDTESVPIISKGTDGADSTVAGPSGAPGPRIYSGYLYYQGTAASPGPNAPSNSSVSMDFDTGVLSGGVIGTGSTNWNQNPPTFVAGNSNKYWYVYYTAEETGTYANGAYPTQSVTFGTTVYQGMGFSGLVTFTSDGYPTVDGGAGVYDPFDHINSTGDSTGASATTTINGAYIKTGSITATRLNFTPITSIANQTGSTITTAALAGATGLNLGALANQNAINLSNQVSGTLGLGAGGTGSTTGPFGYATSTGFITGAGITLLTDVFANSSKTGISSNFTTQITAAKIFMSNTIAAGSSSGLTVTNTNELSLDTTAITLTSTQVGLGNVANSNPSDQVKGAFTSVTAITAGSINLKSGSAGIDISAANQRITITDTNGVTRVKLGQL